jgi:hypothetical protein
VVLVGAVRIMVFEEKVEESAISDLIYGLMCSRYEPWYGHGGGMSRRPNHLVAHLKATIGRQSPSSSRWQHPAETELMSSRCDSPRTLGAKRLEVCCEEHSRSSYGGKVWSLPVGDPPPQLHDGEAIIALALQLW